MKVKIFSMLAIAAFMTIFVFGCGNKKEDVQKECASIVKQIGTALITYSIDKDGKLPPSLETLNKEEYLSDLAVFICPADKHTKSSAAEFYTSFLYNSSAKNGDAVVVCPIHGYSVIRDSMEGNMLHFHISKNQK